MNRYRKWRTRVGANGVDALKVLRHHVRTPALPQLQVRNFRVSPFPAKPPSSIQFLIKTPIVKLPAKPSPQIGPPLPKPVHGKAELSQFYEMSKTRKFHQRHATSGSSGGAGHDEGLGGP